MKLETSRLILQSLTLDDVDNLFDLDSSPDVMKYLGRPLVTEKEYVKSVLEKKLEYNKNYAGLGYWACKEKKSGLFIGQFSLAHIDFDPAKEIEIGFRMQQNFWNMGFATEMGKFLMKYGQEYLKLKQIVALVHPENSASQKVLEKIGLKYVREDFYNGNRLKVFETGHL